VQAGRPGPENVESWKPGGLRNPRQVGRISGFQVATPARGRGGGAARGEGRPPGSPSRHQSGPERASRGAAITTPMGAPPGPRSGALRATSVRGARRRGDPQTAHVARASGSRPIACVPGSRSPSDEAYEAHPGAHELRPFGDRLKGRRQEPIGDRRRKVCALRAMDRGTWLLATQRTHSGEPLWGVRLAAASPGLLKQGPLELKPSSALMWRGDMTKGAW